MLVSAIICTHNRKDLVTHAVRSLQLLTIPAGVKLEILVILNACTDDSINALQNFKNIRIINESKLGLAVARNRGIQEARGDILALLDDDIDVSCDWLKMLHGAFTIYRADCVSGRVTLWWQAVQKPEWFDCRHSWALSEFDRGNNYCVLDPAEGIGANFAFTRQTIDKLGPFRDGMDRSGRSLSAGGDTEYMQRVKNFGLKNVYSPGMVAHWVKPERLEIGTFGTLGYQQGRALVKMKPTLGKLKLIRSFCGYLYISILHLFPLMMALLTNQKGDARHHLSRSACGWGGVVEWLNLKN